MNKLQKLKYISIGVVSTLIVTFTMPAIAKSIDALFNSVNIVVDGVQVAKIGDSYKTADGEVVPYSLVYKGTTYLPMRRMGELIDKKVDWNNKTKTAILGKDIAPEPPVLDLTYEEYKAMWDIELYLRGEQYYAYNAIYNGEMTCRELKDFHSANYKVFCEYNRQMATELQAKHPGCALSLYVVHSVYGDSVDQVELRKQ